MCSPMATDASTFNGGPGDDVVEYMDIGTFSGGSGANRVDHYDGGTVWSADTTTGNCP